MTGFSEAGSLKTLRVPVLIGGNNLPSPVGIGLTDLPNIGETSGPPGPPVPASLDYIGIMMQEKFNETIQLYFTQPFIILAT